MAQNMVCLSWPIFHGHLKRMCVWGLLGEVLYKCHLGYAGWQFSSGLLCPLLIFCLLVLSLTERGVLNSPHITVDLSIAFLMSIGFCFMHFEALFSFLVTSFLFFCLSVGYLHMILGFHLGLFISSTRTTNIFLAVKPQRVITQRLQLFSSPPITPSLSHFTD